MKPVAQASCLWGNWASRLVDGHWAGRMPAGPTAKMAVLLGVIATAER
jgi:hypothetical protein